MTYTMTNWQDLPSNSTPFTSANMLLYNAAVNDLDSRVALTTPTMAVVGVVSANYTALINQFVPVNTSSGNITITLPSAPVDGSRCGAKQVVRVVPNTVTISAAGSDVFNTTTGPTTVSLSGVNQAAIFQYVAAIGVWINISDDVPLAQTTSRAIAMSMVLGAFSP